MKRSLIYLILPFFIATEACTKRLDLGSFDSDTWKSDLKGCSGERARIIDQLIEVKPKLLGLYQKSIIKALGQPEGQELSKRSQTYYVYFIDAAPTCQNSAENPRKLEVRFTSLGIANEVNIK